MGNPQGKQLVLASTSAFRKVSLARLGLAFDTADPGVDETPQPGEGAGQLARRLSLAKARAVWERLGQGIIIAGDQVLEANGANYGKPGDLWTAARHLRELSGTSGTFHSGMCVINDEDERCVCVPTQVTWRKLSEQEIDSYVRREPSPHSAGAAQLEGLGITLVERMSSEDPTAILGLPLIQLSKILRAVGLELP